MADCVPFHLPGNEITGHANVAVIGCRFVVVTPAVNEVDGNVQVSPAGAGVKPFAVAGRDKAAGAKVLLYRDGIVPVEAGAALAHGQFIETDAVGRAIPLAAGVRCGTVLADAANGAQAQIALELK